MGAVADPREATGTDGGDGELEALVREVFERRIPFNRELGLVIDSLGPDEVAMSFERRDWMVGNFVHGSLHGGITSSVLDVAGGLAVFVDLLRSTRSVDATPLDRIRRLGAISTIDLRVDYLRAGVAPRFVAAGRVLRSGNRVAVTRTELRDPAGELVAVGTASYRIGRPGSNPSASLPEASG